MPHVVDLHPLAGRLYFSSV
jgi:hypothetical protein